MDVVAGMVHWCIGAYPSLLKLMCINIVHIARAMVAAR